MLVLFLFLQYTLWLGDGGIRGQKELEAKIEEQQSINEELRERNALIAEEVEALRTDEGLEERARQELGLVGEGETFIMVIEEEEPETER